jgi:hypothetical protein
MNNLIALFLPLICVPCRPVIINNPLSRYSLIHFSFPDFWDCKRLNVSVLVIRFQLIFDICYHLHTSKIVENNQKDI